MRTGRLWRGLLAALLVLTLTSCGFSPHEVDQSEVGALQDWLEERPEVDSVDTLYGQSFRAGLPGEDEWARTRAVVGPGVTAEELIALGEALRDRDEPLTITNAAEIQLDGLSIMLGYRPESDARSVELLFLVRDALGEIRPLPAPDRLRSDLPPDPSIGREITLWFDPADLDAAAAALSAIDPPGGEEVRVDLRAEAAGEQTGGYTRVFVLGGEDGSAVEQRAALSAVLALEEAGLPASLWQGTRGRLIVEAQVTTLDEWALAVDTLAEHAPEAVLSTSLPAEALDPDTGSVAIDLPMAALPIEDAHRLPDLVGSPPDPWLVSKVELTEDGRVQASVGSRGHELADLEALAAVGEWGLSEVVDAYRFSAVEDGTLSADTALVLPSTGWADLFFLEVYRAAERADRVHPHVDVEFDGIFRLSWSEGVVAATELRPVLEELRGPWGEQRLSVTEFGRSADGDARIFFDTTGTGAAREVGTAPGLSPTESRDLVEELDWVVELWDETVG